MWEDDDICCQKLANQTKLPFSSFFPWRRHFPECEDSNPFSATRGALSRRPPYLFSQYVVAKAPLPHDSPFPGIRVTQILFHFRSTILWVGVRYYKGDHNFFKVSIL
jgi:hypothetical protein